MAVKEKKELKTKKEQKKFPAKKLPSLFKKTYTEKKFEKKILSKIYIPADKAEVKALFKKGADSRKPECYAVPSDLTFTKKDLVRFKTLAKEINANKGRIKLVPLIATVACVAAFVVVVGVFKNPLAKKIIKSTCESVFLAKTDVGSVDLKILDASLTVKNLAVGNKDDVMKNLFEAETIALDFNLVQALRGKFDAQNIAVTGITLGTERETSCALPAKAKKEKKQTEKESKDSAFMQSLKAKSESEIAELKTMLSDILGGEDVDSIVQNVQSQLKTPAAVEDARKQISELTEKWSAKPAELSRQVSDFSKSVQDLQSINVNNIKDAATLKSTLEKINSAITTGKKLSDSTSGLSESIKADSAKVKAVTENVSSAAKSDKAYAQERLGAAANFVKNAKSIFTNALDSVGYSVLGKYYPYAKKAVDKAVELKSNADENKKVQSAEKASGKSEKSEKKASKKIKKEGSRRLAGTTFWYTKDTPAFLIEHISASGTNFTAEAAEITNDQNLRGKPTVLKGSFSVQDTSHSGNLVLDIRSESTAPLICVDYTGNGFSTAFDGTTVALQSGVPSVNGKARLTLKGSAGNGIFSAYGNVSLNPVSFSSDGFENSTLTKYYNQALGSVKNLSLGYKMNYTEADGVNLSLDGNFADAFISSLQKVALSAGNDAKDAALKKIQEEINSSSGTVTAKAKEFFGIEGDINVQNAKLSDIQKALDTKKAELEAQIKKQAEDTAKNAAKNAAGSALKKLGL